MDNNLHQVKEIAQLLLAQDGKIVHKWFEDTWPKVEQIFIHQPEDYSTWLELIKELSGINWELFLNLFKETPRFLREISLEHYRQWLQQARHFYRIDEKTALIFIRTGFEQISPLKPPLRSHLLANSGNLQKINWEGAFAYYEHFPRLQATQADEQITPWEAAVFYLGKEAPELLKSFIAGSANLLVQSLQADWQELAKKGLELHKLGATKVAGHFFDFLPKMNQMLKEEDKYFLSGNWYQLVFDLAKLDTGTAEVFVTQSNRGLKILTLDQFVQWQQAGAKIAAQDGKAGAGFFLTSLEVVSETSFQDLISWIEAGLHIPEERRLRLFFSRKSKESQEALKKHQLTLPLEKVHKSLTAMAEANFNRAVLIRDTTVLPVELYQEQAVLPTNDGYRVYLPAKITKYDQIELNFKLYKLMLFHQLACLTQDYLTDIVAFINSAGQNKIFAQPADERLFREVIQLVLGWEADCYLWQICPGLKKDLKIILEPYLAQLALLEQNQNTRKTGEVIRWSLQATNQGKGAPRLSAEELIAKAMDIYQELRQKCQPADSCLTIAAHRVPYRGIINWELVEISALVKNNWEKTSGKVEAVELIDQISCRFIQGQKVNFSRTLVERLLELHRQEAEDAYSSILFFDEWDYTLDDYKRDWCRVREITLRSQLGNSVDLLLAEHRNLISMMKKYFALLRPDRVRRLNRQPDGDQLDLDAVVEAITERRMGIASAENLYIRRDKRERDVAVAFLLDCSGSTEERIVGNKTILDLEKEAVLIMAEALDMLGDNFGIYAFSSDGRLQVDYFVVKDFYEQYNESVRQRFAALRSLKMTRLAAAIRHTVGKLQQVKAAVKLLFILSDGRPFDMDYRAQEKGEDSIKSWLLQDDSVYPQADTRVALWEAKANGVTPFCLTVDKNAKDYMDQIFSQVGYVLINDVSMLPVKLPEIYRRLTT